LPFCLTRAILGFLSQSYPNGAENVPSSVVPPIFSRLAPCITGPSRVIRAHSAASMQPRMQPKMQPPRSPTNRYKRTRKRLGDFSGCRSTESYRNPKRIKRTRKRQTCTLEHHTGCDTPAQVRRLFGTSSLESNLGLTARTAAANRRRRNKVIARKGRGRGGNRAADQELW